MEWLVGKVDENAPGSASPALPSVSRQRRLRLVSTGHCCSGGEVMTLLVILLIVLLLIALFGGIGFYRR